MSYFKDKYETPLTLKGSAIVHTQVSPTKISMAEDFGVTTSENALVVDKYTYEAAQERFSKLLSPTKLRERRLTGKGAQGYEEGVLAAKSLFKEMFGTKKEK